MACSFCPYPLKEDKKSKLAFDEIQKNFTIGLQKVKCKLLTFL